MNQSKRQWSTTTDGFDEDDQQITNKLQRTSSRLITSITSFEDFSAELIYEVFDYLTLDHIYNGFFHLNTRFQNLLLYLNIPIKINNISSSSKSTFQNYFTDFILPMQHQMKKLHVSDPFTIEYMFSITENISVYSQLQTLYLENIEPEYLLNLLNRLIILPNLSSLTVHVGYDTDKISLYNQIFQLPKLKYCELSFEELSSLASLPTFTNPSSPIEQLIIRDHYSLNEVDAILSNLPQLHRFTIITRHGISNLHRPIIIFILLNNLTQISFTLDQLQSDDMEKFVKNHVHEIKLLHFFTYFGRYNLDIEASIKSILSYLPCSKIVQIPDTSEIVCHHTLELYQSLFSCYSSRILSSQQCSFTLKPISDEYLHETLCSFEPFKKKNYIINCLSKSYKYTCHIKNTLQSVHNITIGNDHEIDYEKIYPNVTELTISVFFNNHSTSLSNTKFRRMIPVTQITKLTIENKYKSFDQVLDVLFQIPNIHTLTLTFLKVLGKYIPSLQENQIFGLVSKQNKIKNITITDKYTLKTVQMLIELCPELQHLTLGISQRSLIPTVRFLLSENNEIPCKISSLCVLDPQGVWTPKLITEIQSERPLNDYSLKFFNQKLYLWW